MIPASSGAIEDQGFGRRVERAERSGAYGFVPCLGRADSQRRIQMKRGFGLGLLLFLFAASGMAQQGVPAPAKAFATAPDIPYESASNFLKLPAGLYLGEAVAVATNSKGHVFAYTRSGEASRLFEFDQNGTFLREIGQGLYGFQMAHAVRVDSQDNIWAVDEGTDMVIKFNPQGRVVMLLGRRPESHGLAATEPNPHAPAKPYTFGRPTDIAWDAAGNIFISD